MRILETALTNAYTLGDPEAQTWGYMLLNYGPDMQSMYEEVDQDGRFLESAFFSHNLGETQM